MNITRHDQTAILSQAVEYGDTVYLAGIVAKDLGQDIKGQTKQILDEIDRLLAKCGSGKSKVLQCHIWVTDIRNRVPMNEVDRVGRQEEPSGAGLRRGQARRSESFGRDHGNRRQITRTNVRELNRGQTPISYSSQGLLQVAS